MSAGTIKIVIERPLGRTTREFDADDGGHAVSIQRAIQFLVFELKDAIAEDHRLHELGQHPPLADYGKGQDQGGSHP